MLAMKMRCTQTPSWVGIANVDSDATGAFMGWSKEQRPTDINLLVCCAPPLSGVHDVTRTKTKTTTTMNSTTLSSGRDYSGLGE